MMMINVDGRLFPESAVAKISPDSSSTYEVLAHGVELRGVREITRVEVLPAPPDTWVLRVYEGERGYFTEEEPCLAVRVETSLVDSENNYVRPVVAGDRAQNEVARFFYDRGTGVLWDDNERYADMAAMERTYPPEDIDAEYDAELAAEQAREDEVREHEDRVHAG